MIERNIFCPAYKLSIKLRYDPMYSKSGISKCDKCGLSFQVVNNKIQLCYSPGVKINPITGAKEIIEQE